MKIQKAAFIAFPATDFAESFRFYHELLELPLVSQGTDKFSKFARFDCNGFGIHLYEWTKPFTRAHTGLQLYVEDVDALYADLRSKGVEFRGDIRDELWGGRVVTVSDPDGNLFDLLNSDFDKIISTVTNFHTAG